MLSGSVHKHAKIVKNCKFSLVSVKVTLLLAASEYLGCRLVIPGLICISMTGAKITERPLWHRIKDQGSFIVLKEEIGLCVYKKNFKNHDIRKQHTQIIFLISFGFMQSWQNTKKYFVFFMFQKSGSIWAFLKSKYTAKQCLSSNSLKVNRWFL